LYISNIQLPANIYDANSNNFNIIIKFNEENYWKIWIEVDEPIQNDKLPTIYLRISNNSDIQFYAPDMILKIYPDKKIRVITGKNYR
jgi:hypothetical protein